MHHSVRVDLNQGHPLQSRDEFRPRSNLCQEGLDPLTLALLRVQGLSILANHLETEREDGESSPGIAPVPRSSATNRGIRGGGRSTMEV